MTRLRSGFTTGACAAAAAKGATLALLGQACADVNIPFPDSSRRRFQLHRCAAQDGMATASVLKDAGDDPDVTNGAEIVAAVRIQERGGGDEAIAIRAGAGVGTVTKPGLAIPVGEPAINPVPRQMIRAAVMEAMQEAGCDGLLRLCLTVSIPDGEQLAKKTLNQRLGIVGGLSILGTTGIVRPVSAEAWTATIETSMQVARAAGLDEVLLSTGRTSEAAVQARLCLPDEAQVMMGDYLFYALDAARRHGFRRIHLAGMWGKVLKCALGIPQTHVRHGVLDVRQAAELLVELGLDKEAAVKLAVANTARELLQAVQAQGRTDLVRAVCLRARLYAEQCSGLPVQVWLVTTEDGVIESA